MTQSVNHPDPAIKGWAEDGVIDEGWVVAGPQLDEWKARAERAEAERDRFQRVVIKTCQTPREDGTMCGHCVGCTMVRRADYAAGGESHQLAGPGGCGHSGRRRLELRRGRGVGRRPHRSRQPLEGRA